MIHVGVRKRDDDTVESNADGKIAEESRLTETVYRTGMPVSAALVTDTHNTDSTDITASLLNRRPEMIFIAGDIFYGVPCESEECFLDRQKNTVKLLESCASIAPTFLSLGNHERYISVTDIRKIEDMGVSVRDNTWVRCGDIVVGGLTSASVTSYQRYRASADPGCTYPKRRRNQMPVKKPLPDTSWLSSFESQDGYKVLLCHHPEYRDLYLSGRKIDLIVSGHAHGGQIRVFGHGIYSPGQGIFPKYTGGMYGNMIVSRGLSNTGFVIPRLFNECEIVYIDR